MRAATPAASALRARHVQRGPRDVGGHHVHVRPLGGDAHRDAARAGADVGDAARQRRRIDRQQVEQLLDDELGFGPRNQHLGRDVEFAAPELLPAADVGGRLTAGAALDQRVERLFESGRQRIVLPQQHLRARPAQHVARQQVGVEHGLVVVDAGAGQPGPRRRAGVGEVSLTGLCVASRSFSAV